MKGTKYYLLFFLILLIIIDCKKKELPVIATNDVSSITKISAQCGGNITDDGGESIISRGVCWSTNTEPTIAENLTTDGTGTGTFTSEITGLTPNTSYQVRAYATNKYGIGYGDTKSFVTDQATIPIVTTSAVTSITQTTAISGGQISDDGASPVTSRGVCWSTSQNPTISDNKTIDGSGTGDFTSSITGLVGNTTYYLRAYATNSVGIAYGEDRSFTTSAVVASVTTSAITNITSTTATSGGNVTSDGGSTVTACGVCWSLSQNPTVAHSHTSDGTGTGTFTSSITGLEPNTTYYVRAFATNSAGTAYGNQVSFVTLSLPTITTSPVISITYNSAIIGGAVVTEGSTSVTERGIFWGTSPNPNITGTKYQLGAGAGSFSTNLTGLTNNITYYVVSYAISSIGTVFGNEVIFNLWINTPGPQVTDVEENIYNSVKIGNQIWMTENLKTTKYNNGDIIGTTIPATLDITSENTPKYQWPSEGNESQVVVYGRLYTWYTATDPRKICPTGWHVPSDIEWTTLTTYLGGEFAAGGKLKEADLTHWESPNAGATNESGFTALPGSIKSINGDIGPVGQNGYWWTSTSWYDTEYAWYRDLYCNFNDINRAYLSKKLGFSVRCIKD